MYCLCCERSVSETLSAVDKKRSRYVPLAMYPPVERENRVAHIQKALHVFVFHQGSRSSSIYRQTREASSDSHC